MNRETILSLAALFLALLTISGCSKTNYISVRVKEPASVSIPSHIKSIAVLDRSLPPSEVQKIVTGVVTGENSGRNEQQAQYALNGLIGILKESDRLQVKTTDRRWKGEQTGGALPKVLHPDSIERLCNEYDVDGIIALESFSYSTIVNTTEKAIGLVESGVKNGILSTINKTVQTASTINNEDGHTIIVKLAFRFYERKGDLVFDQMAYSHTYNWHSNTHFQYKHSKNETSYYAGLLYGKRVVPSYIWVDRNYFKKPKNNGMKMATRMAITGDWNGASELWHQMEKEGSRKGKGRAAYNLALSYEVAGDLTQAIFWCRKSKLEYGNKLASVYLKSLEDRLKEQKLIEEQMVN